ncbi:MAG: type II secretion system protein GspK [Thermodesulfobacteriota bacterium]
MNRILQNKKGAALVVTLAIVAILVAAALELGKFTGKSAMATLKGKDMFQAEQYALSGINLARLILCEDAAKNRVDSIQEPWADSDILFQAVDEMGLARENLTIKITDELSKIQVNAMVKEFPGNLPDFDQIRIWERLLQLRLSEEKDLDKRDPALIINCVKDWLDSLDDDAITGISGAESDYYLDLNPPYVCANGPFNHVDELLNVKGITKNLLKDGNIDETEEPASDLDLKDVFTVHGLDGEILENNRYTYKGRININTAKLEVIKALLPQGMEDFAQDLVEFREEKSEEGDIFVNSLDKGWYKKVIALSEEEQKKFERVISYSSNIFKIEAEGVENSSKIKLCCWVQRERQKESGTWICRIIQMERE